jgi:hypothetical protein
VYVPGAAKGIEFSDAAPFTKGGMGADFFMQSAKGGQIEIVQRKKEILRITKRAPVEAPTPGALGV